MADRRRRWTISTVLNGTLRITGQIANAAGGLTGTITGFLGSDIGRGVQNLTQRILDQRADIRGNVTVTSSPQLQSNWRIEPNLTGQVTVADGGVTIAGIKLNVGGEVKPMLDRAVNEQMTALQNRLRSDPTLEQTARREWAKMCRSISLGAARPGMPSLWLEMRPTRAFAAQPRIDPDWAILTVGVQAETRIVPSETKPTCPFPAQLDIVPPMDQRQGRNRRADRHAVHRTQQAAGGAAQGQDLPRGRQRPRRGHGAARQRSPPPATGC